MAMQKKTICLLTGVVPVFCLLFSLTASAGGDNNTLPRSFGAFSLGMTAKAFETLTGVSPRSCPVCAEHESFATLSSDQALHHTPSDLIGQGIDFFFYHGQLYQMTIAPPPEAAGQARQDFDRYFGPSSSPENRGNGIARLKWQSPSTLLTLNYHTKTDEAFVINFYDARLLQQRQQHKLPFHNASTDR